MLIVKFGLLVASLLGSSVNAEGNSKHSILPAFKWAQSPDDVHLYIKFAHKIDAPAYNNFAKSNVKVEITEKSISMVASNDEKQFELELELFKNIDPEASTYSVHTFGVSFVLRKVDKVWKRLLKDPTLKPRNMHLWWELYDKYQDEMEKLQAEAESESKDNKKWWKRFDHKCEACHTMVEEAAFSDQAIQRLKKALHTEMDRAAAEEAQKAAEKAKKAAEEAKAKEENETEEAGSEENSDDDDGKEEEDDEKAKKNKKLKQTVKVAGSVVKKVCEHYNSDVISTPFKKACKKLRKKRDIKKQVVITMGVVLEMIRKDEEMNPSALKPGFIANHTERSCSSVCPRSPKKISSCKACNTVMNSIHAHVVKHKQKLSKEQLVDGTCERVLGRMPSIEEEDYESVSYICNQ